MIFASAIFWGMLSYSLVVLGSILGLAIKLALLFRDRGVLRSELAEAESQINDLNKVVKGLQNSIKRYQAEIRGLENELNQTDSDLSTDGVADRLKRLLSEEVPEDKDGQG